MCLFSGRVAFVANTSIFARRDGDRQVLVYEMSVGFSSDVAMILPLPVATGAGEDAVSFVDLGGYPEFFRHLAAAFPVEEALAASPGRGVPRAPRPAPLKVHDVGSFEASYVPGARDFDRLDRRFRLSEEAWAALAPRYATWGFAVFKLRGGGPIERLLGTSRAPKLHPMALSFPTREARLFFPTVHVHDGTAPSVAAFDHTLYAQSDAPPAAAQEGWVAASRPVREVADPARALGLLSGAPAYRRTLTGLLPNEDQRL